MSAYDTRILGDGPLAYYRLADGKGTRINDSGGHGRTATANGTITPGQAGIITRDTDSAMLFDGSSGYINCPMTGLPTGAAPWTIECWAMMPTLPVTNAYNMMLSFGTYANREKATLGYYRPTNNLILDVYGDQMGVATVTAGTTYHLVGTYDGVNCTLYVNGTQNAQKPETMNITLAFCTIGAGNASPADQFPGILAKATLYTFCLTPAQIMAHYQLGIYTGLSNLDASVSKFLMAKVYDSAGNFITVLKDAPILSGFKEQINAAADPLRFTLPRAIDAFDGQYQPQSMNTLVQGNVIQWWLYGAGLPTAGLLKYQGIIDSITPTLGDHGGESVEVVVTPYSQILGDHGVSSAFSIGTAGSSATYVDSGTIFRSFFTGQYQDATGTTQSTIDANTSKPYGSPYTLDPTSTTLTGQKVQAAFQNQTLLSALSTVLLLSPANYFFRMNQDKTVYFGLYPTTPTYTLLLGQHISMLQYSLDNVPRKNVVVIQGKGTVKATAVGSSVATLGERVYFKNDNRITDTATAQILANGILALYDRPQIRATAKIPDYRGDAMPGLGYDIERFRVGQTVKIVDAKAPPSSIQGVGGIWGQMIWGSGKWGAPSNTPAIWGAFNWGAATWGASFGNVFNTVIPIMAITYDYFSVTLELGWRQPTLNRKLYLLESAFSDSSMVS